MYNRLTVARDLLSAEGAIFIQIDYIELAHLKIICDDVFGAKNFVQIISMKTATPAGFKVVNPGPINVTEFILMYTKDKSGYNFKKGYVPAPYQKDYKYYLTNPKEKPEKWEIADIKSKCIKELGFSSEKNMKEEYGVDVTNAILEQKIELFALQNASSVFTTYGPHKPAGVLRDLIDASKNEPKKIFFHERENNSPFILLNGRLFAFYDKKLQTIDGKFVPTQLLTDFWNDLSWDSLSFEGGVTFRNGKKPEKLLQRIIELSSEENDIVLDYHLGSGTSCAVAHKMKRQYIGIEQLDYDENDASVRLKNVIEGDKTGVSTALNWQGGGSFTYMELAKNNQNAKELINKCKSYKELIKLFDTLYSKYFLHYNVRINEFKNTISKEENFKKLSLERQKEIFSRMLDNNQLYVHTGEMEDKQYGLSKDDIRLTKDFYQL